MSSTYRGLRALTLAAVCAAFLNIPAALASGSGSHGHGKAEPGHHGGGHGTDIGAPGEPRDVRRNIRITMTDNAFKPAKLKVKAGETVRFKVMNNGEFVHEFNIATVSMHAAHQQEMAEMMEKGHMTVDRIVHPMAHAHGNSILLEPGQGGEIIWRFPAETALEFACNVPGHYESGMRGPVTIR